MKSRENNEEIVVVVIVTETSGEVSGSIVFPKDTQILVIPLYLLTIFNGAKVHRVRKRLYPFLFFFLGAHCVESGVSCTDCY